MQTPVSLLISVVVLLSAAGCGRWVRLAWRGCKTDEPASERLVVDAAVGLGVLSLLFFALAALHLLSIVYLSAAIFIGLIQSPAVLRDVAALARRLRGRHPLKSWLAAALLLVIAIAVLIPALAPPGMDDWDSLAYHLTVPRLYLDHGGFYYINYTTHSNFPFLMEMLYLPGLALNDPVAAKLMHYWVGLLMVAAVVVLVRRHFEPRAAWMAAIALAGIPLVMWEATTAYVDLATGLYTVLAVHLLLNYLREPNAKRAALCGLAAGMAASTKMTALAIIPMLAVWLVIDRWVENRRFEWKAPLWLIGAALLVAAPWYVKSIIYAGSPVYPFFYSVFGGRDWNTWLAGNYTMLQKQFGVGHGILQLLAAPYDLTFRSAEFYDRPGLYVGPILLLAAPVMLLAKYRSRALVGLALFTVAQVVVWFGLSQQSRYLVPIYALAGVLISVLATRDDRFGVARAALMFAFVVTALFGLLITSAQIARTYPVAFGAETRDAYLSRAVDIYPAQQFMNSDLESSGRVALFGDTRGFYLRRPFVWADAGHNLEFTRSYSSVKDFVSYLKSRGVRYAMVNFGISFPPREKATGTAEMVYRAIGWGHFQQVFPQDNTGHVAVYRIQ